MSVVKRARAFVFSATFIVAGVVLYVPIALVMAVGLSFAKPQPARTLPDFDPVPKPLKEARRSRAV